MKPLKLKTKRNVPGGVEIVFTHNKCGADHTLYFSDNDELRAQYPLSCECGESVNLYFGSPELGRELLIRLKGMPADEQDFFQLGEGPSLN